MWLCDRYLNGYGVRVHRNNYNQVMMLKMAGNTSGDLENPSPTANWSPYDGNASASIAYGLQNNEWVHFYVRLEQSAAEVNLDEDIKETVRPSSPRACITRQVQYPGSIIRLLFDQAH